MSAFRAGAANAQQAPTRGSAARSADAELLLRRSARTLSEARSLALDLDFLREVRLDDGRVVSLASSTGIAMRRPDGLRAEIRGDATIAA
jgi:hypothetical protein